jgi:hypothetical protein
MLCLALSQELRPNIAEMMLGPFMNAPTNQGAMGADQPDYGLCDVPGSRHRFRGPSVDFDEPFVAVLGGTETFGKYVTAPYPSLLGRKLNTPVMNFGIAQVGLTLLCDDDWLLDRASQADLTVLQVPSAQNMSNRLYSVHSRRNDRFLNVSPALRAIFPKVDFADIHFTGHLLEVLQAASRSGFEIVVNELKLAWVRRMQWVLALIQSRVLLLWVADHRPDARACRIDATGPSFVDRSMLDTLQDQAIGLVEYVSHPTHSVEGMVFPENERRAARSSLGPEDHAAIANALAEALVDVGWGLGAPVKRAQTARL